MRLRVSTGVPVVVLHSKRPEPADLDVVSMDEGGPEGVKDVINRFLCLALRNTGALNQHIDQITLEHHALP